MYNFRKLEPDSFPILNDFFMRLVVIITNMTFKKCYDEKSTLEDLYNSPKPIFSKWPMYILQSHAWLTNPFKMQDRPIGFNATVCEKFTGTISFSTLQ